MQNREKAIAEIDNLIEYYGNRYSGMWSGKAIEDMLIGIKALLEKPEEENKGAILWQSTPNPKPPMSNGDKAMAVFNELTKGGRWPLTQVDIETAINKIEGNHE